MMTGLIFPDEKAFATAFSDISGNSIIFPASKQVLDQHIFNDLFAPLSIQDESRLTALWYK